MCKFLFCFRFYFLSTTTRYITIDKIERVKKDFSPVMGWREEVMFAIVVGWGDVIEKTSLG